ncbi:helix-turn-helix transcriptional regulator [Ochrobactrum quorumnocens]|uniref:XRE family transcriptional regulator n=1 Tax=Ochrobactrum quorumnocens TaxID=271865 RepID=A0A5N1JMI6_9HYPH|nr:XRE family transcriptional regulator [[Ochrobactrum] quorumnocens]KAA9354264.1 XRE family transcriptional regulator [[Ochrobactrum] quorumnocens]
MSKNLDFAPRGLSRTGAAYYIGVSTSKLDEMVKDGRMPAPKMIDSRVVWDRREIDLAFDELSYREPEKVGNPWDD